MVDPDQFITYTLDILICRDANLFDFCQIIPIFKADFLIAISNIKITANDNFKMVPNKITGVALTS